MMAGKSQNDSKTSGDYCLLVSRLTNFYKRVDIAIKACTKLNLPLKIVGEGIDQEVAVTLPDS